MAPTEKLQIQVGDLLKRIGAQRIVEVQACLSDLIAGTAAVANDEPIVVDLMLERISDGVVVRGSLQTAWSAPCSRCLAESNGPLAVSVDELYEPEPIPGETYLLAGEILDLEPMVRDALVLELPTVPMCRPNCAGLCGNCGVDRNAETCACETQSEDPRWAALQSLDLD